MNNWISFRDQFPAPNTRVILHTDKGDSTIGQVVNFEYDKNADECEFHFRWQKEIDGEITHWAPLPTFKNQ